MENSKRPTPTIKEVAEYAGVSIATVSRVLTGKDVVSKKLRKRVEHAIQILGYSPNRAARELRAGSVLKIGVVLSDIQNPFFTRCLAGIENILQKSDYILILGNSNEDPMIEAMHLTSLASEGVAGIILAMTADNEDCYSKINDQSIPIVAIDRECDRKSLDAVVIDNVKAAYQATQHLLQLGHRRIAYIGGLAHTSTAHDREEGFLKALREYGIDPDPDLITSGAFLQTGGYQAMHELLKLKNPPSAVLVANNLMTLGALQIIHELDIRIPNQISLVGFDDTPWNIAMQTPLTVIAQPTYQLGEIAARLLLERINNPSLPRQKIILEAELIVRASTAPPHQTDRHPHTPSPVK